MGTLTVRNELNVTDFNMGWRGRTEIIKFDMETYENFKMSKGVSFGIGINMEFWNLL